LSGFAISPATANDLFHGAASRRIDRAGTRSRVLFGTNNLFLLPSPPPRYAIFVPFSRAMPELSLKPDKRATMRNAGRFRSANNYQPDVKFDGRKLGLGDNRRRYPPEPEITNNATTPGDPIIRWIMTRVKNNRGNFSVIRSAQR